MLKQFIYFCIHIYTLISIYIQQQKINILNYFNIIQPFYINKVILYNNNRKHNITTDYLNKVHSFSEFDKCIFYWTFYNKKYYTIIKSKNDLIKFIPYSFYEMSQPSENKIISAFLINNDKTIENVTSLVKQYSGPKNNFYSDIDLEVCTSDLFNISDKQLKIIMVGKELNYNLNQPNKIKI